MAFFSYREAGIFLHWSGDFKTSEDRGMDTFFETGYREETAQPEPLTVENVSGALAILTVGLALSTIVFVLECFIDKIRLR